MENITFILSIFYTLLPDVQPDIFVVCESRFKQRLAADS